MARRRKNVESGGEDGAPEWMVTFSDCMTLLLTFFVLLLSFSSFDEKVFQRFMLLVSQKLPGVSSPAPEHKEDLVGSVEQFAEEEHSQGSEKPTLEREGEAKLKSEAEQVDFRERKLFLVGSGRIFWGRGAVISSEGRAVLERLGLFLGKVAGRLVVSERGPVGEDENLGLERAWRVTEYLISKAGLNRDRFSLSVSGLAAGKDEQQGGSGIEAGVSGRVIEIVLLQRSI